MTEAQAIKTLQLCERFWLGAKGLSVDQVLAKGKAICRHQIFLGGFIVSSRISAFDHEKTGFLFNISVGLLLFGIVIIGVNSWFLIRLKQASRVLNYATDGSSRLSGSK